MVPRLDTWIDENHTVFLHSDLISSLNIQKHHTEPCIARNMYSHTTTGITAVSTATVISFVPTVSMSLLSLLSLLFLLSLLSPLSLLLLLPLSSLLSHLSLLSLMSPPLLLSPITIVSFATTSSSMHHYSTVSSLSHVNLYNTGYIYITIILLFFNNTVQNARDFIPSSRVQQSTV